MIPWILVSLTLTAAGVFAGLWWGERGRRLDAQKVASRRALAPPRPAIVDGKAPDPQPEPAKTPGAPAPERHLDDGTREKMRRHFMYNMDVDEETAEKAVDEIEASLLGQAGIS